MKRIFALALCLCLLLTAFPVSAVPETEEGRICQEITDHYVQILDSTDMASLQGYCGLMASWQLFYLGVNDWVMSNHGKDQFDAYCQIAVTSGGHPVKTYSYLDYTLEEALNAITKNGTQDVYNLLVGFEKTSSALGSIYGHSIVIYAILDGVVYFTESYDTSLGRAGTPYRVTLEEFVDYYDDWTVFEGIALFGKKGYAANCSAYASNLFGEAIQDVPMYSQPCTPETPDAGCRLLRTVHTGERLWVNALFENPEGERYYQIDDSGTAGYVAAECVSPIRFNYEDVEIANLQISQRMQPGEEYDFIGRITAQYSAIDEVALTVTDSSGKAVLSHALAKHSGVYDLESDTFDLLADFRVLEEGSYTVTVEAEGVNHYVQSGKIRTDSQRIPLVNQVLYVGNAPEVPMDMPEPTPVTRDGWVYENATWYYYEQGVPRTGWYCYHGADYYLKSDGSVTTGWAVINGKPRFFSRTGSMRTGWIETEQGRMYLMSNGAPAVGKRIIDGREYLFAADGYLQ